MSEPDQATRWQNLTVRARDAAGRPQMAEGSIPEAGETTPNPDFFIVHHYAPAEPDAATWKVEVVGGSGQEKSFDLRALKSFPEHSVTALLECAGLSRGNLPEPKPGTQFGNGLVGTAAWTGARLSDVLQAANVASDFDTLIVTGGDSGTAQPENVHSEFAKGLPRDKALAEDTLLAWAMNGEPLDPLHGGPVRMVVPGWFGVWWVKWPQRLQARAGSGFDGFWQSYRYTFQTEEGAITGVVQSLLPRSLIVSPAAGARVKRGTVRLQGVAWAGEQAVTLVEVTADGGHTWTAAEITSRFGRWAWLRWQADVDLAGPAGLRPVAVRATNESGRKQEWQSAGNRLGYGNNGIHVIKLDVVV
jgi:sulfite oxidase